MIAAHVAGVNDALFIFFSFNYLFLLVSCFCFLVALPEAEAPVSSGNTLLT